MSKDDLYNGYWYHFFYTNMLMDGTVSTIGVYVKLDIFQP